MARRPLVLLAALSVAAPALADPGPEAWLGSWIRVEREWEDAARDEAIDRATDAMSLLLRGIARSMIRQRIQPDDAYRVALEDGVPTIRSSRGRRYPLDGRAHRGVGADTVMSWVGPDGIVQAWRRGAESRGRLCWRLDPSGQRLTIFERIDDTRFVQPIEFSTTYERVEASGLRPASIDAR